MKLHILVCFYMVWISAWSPRTFAQKDTNQPCVPFNEEKSALALPADFPTELTEELESSPDFWERYERLWIDFLNEGATPQALKEIGEQFAWARIRIPADQEVILADVDGDTQTDAVLLVPIYWNAPEVEDVLLVALCRNGQYTAGDLLHIPQNPDSASWIVTVQDLNADAKTEIVISHQFCGAHTCYAHLSLYTWRENRLQLVSRDTDSTSGFGFPYSEVTVTDYDGDGLYTIRIRGTQYGSAGAGYYRPEIVTYEYSSESESWEQTYSLAPTRYIFHLAYEADSYSKSGDYPRAIEIYTRMIYDVSLIDPRSAAGWSEEVYWPAVDKPLRAYAYYRLIMVYSLLGDTDHARELFDSMAPQFFEGSESYVFLQMADTYLKGGCQAVLTTFDESVLGYLNNEAYGYGNPQYSWSDICPF